jgi:hypothetical protein
MVAMTKNYLSKRNGRQKYLNIQLMVLRMNVADLITSSPNAASQYDEYIKR